MHDSTDVETSFPSSSLIKFGKSSKGTLVFLFFLMIPSSKEHFGSIISSKNISVKLVNNAKNVHRLVLKILEKCLHSPCSFSALIQLYPVRKLSNVVYKNFIRLLDKLDIIGYGYVSVPDFLHRINTALEDSVILELVMGEESWF